VRRGKLAGGFRGAREPRTGLKRAGVLAAAFGALEAVGSFSFAPVRAGASVIAPDIQFDISDFLAVPPQNYGTDVQFQTPSVHTVFLASGAGTEADPRRPGGNEPRAGRARAPLSVGAAHVVTFVATGCPTSAGCPAGWCPATCHGWASDAGPTDVSPAPRRRTPAVQDAVTGLDRHAKTRPRPKYAKLCYARRGTRVVPAA
jgi:hypothetical protein